MKIKRIEFAEEILDLDNDNVDVIVENEDGYGYVMCVGTPQNLFEIMNQEKVNFVQPDAFDIIVKQLTRENIIEAITEYAKNDGYWLKLRQFSDEIDISILNKLEADHIKEWENCTED